MANSNREALINLLEEMAKQELGFTPEKLAANPAMAKTIRECTEIYVNTHCSSSCILEKIFPSVAVEPELSDEARRDLLLYGNAVLRMPFGKSRITTVHEHIAGVWASRDSSQL